MEMMQISSLVERLTDEQLVQELQQPSGMAPLQVIMGEIQRRSGLRGGKPRGFARGGMVGPEDEERASFLTEIVRSSIPGANITSAYRTQAEQDALTAAGAPTAAGGVSRHTSGRAVDWVAPSGGSVAEYRRRLAERGLNPEDVLYHPENGSYHLEMPRDWEINGTPAPPPPPPAPGLDGSSGFSNPENITNESLAAGQRIAEQLGLGQGIGTIQERFDDISGMMPDAAAPYDSVISRLQEEEGRERGSNRGRALIDAGLAMMAAPTPNFMSALAAGGAAGFASRDRIQNEERGLMQSVIQAQLARSQAEQQQAASALTSAAGLYEGDRRTLTGAYGAGIELGLGGARSRDNAAQANVTVNENQKNRDHQSRENAALQASTERIRAAEIAAGRWEGKSEEERYATLYQGAYAAASRTGAEMAQRPRLDGSGGTEYRAATEEEIIATAQRAARAGLAGMPGTTPAGGAGGAGGPQIISIDGQPVSAPAAAAPARAPAPAAAPAPAPVPAERRGLGNLPAITRPLNAGAAPPARAPAAPAADQAMRNRAQAEAEARRAREAAEARRRAERERVQRTLDAGRAAIRQARDR